MDLASVGVAIAGASFAGGIALYVVRAEVRGAIQVTSEQLHTHEAVCTERWTETRKKLDHMDGKLDRLVESQ